MRGKVGVLDLVARFRVQNIIKVFTVIVISKVFNSCIVLIFKVFIGEIIMMTIQVRNMSGYVTVYTDLSPASPTGTW